jgi:hypothetical protein
MTLLAPALLLGLTALSLPVVAHLLGREPPRRVRLATVHFLHAAAPVVTRRRRIHDPVLLAVRLALLAGIVAVLARPAGPVAGGLAVVATPHDAVVLLDASASMGLRIDGRSELKRGVERIHALLAALPSGSRVGLVTSDPAGPRFECAAADPGASARIAAALDDWIESGAARPGAWSLDAALADAAAWLPPREGERPRVVYAVADWTAGGLGALPAGAGDPAVIPVPTRPAVDDQPPPVPEHVGLGAASWAPAPDLDARASRITTTVHRRGGSPGSSRPVDVRLRLGDDEVARTRVEIEADAEVPLEFTHTLVGEAAAVAATVEIVDQPDDPLPADDARHLWLAAQDAIDVTLVNGDPNELRAHDEVFFAATAIQAVQSDREIRLRGLAPDQLDARVRREGTAALADVDVLVLANLRAPAIDVAPAIEERVAAGMGLWITVGDRVAPDEYNDRFGRVLPLLMRGSVFAGTLPGRQEARTESLAPPSLSHPLFAELRGELGLAAAQTRRLVLLEPDAERAVAVAVAFASGAPALITSEHGAGRVALLTTTLDRDWTDLPLRPGFVPLVHRTLLHLAGGAAHATGPGGLVGEPRTLAAPGPILVDTPSGDHVPVAAQDGVATFAATDRPGHYLARPAADAEPGTPIPFVVAVDPGESDTTPRAAPAADGDQALEPVRSLAPRWRELSALVLLLAAIESALRLYRRARALSPSGRPPGPPASDAPATAARSARRWLRPRTRASAPPAARVPAPPDRRAPPRGSRASRRAGRPGGTRAVRPRRRAEAPASAPARRSDPPPPASPGRR